MITILGSIVDITGRTGMTINEHKNLHFDNEWDTHVSSETYEESGYGLNLDAKYLKLIAY